MYFFFIQTMPSIKEKAKWKKTLLDLDFEEEFLPVQEVGNENPERGTPQALEQQLIVGVLVVHLPAEGEVKTQERVSHVHQDGVHSCGTDTGEDTPGALS